MKNLRSLLVACAFILNLSIYAQESTQMQQVMTAHDEVMDKMPDLVKLIGQLQPKADTTKAGRKYQKAINNLKASNKSMMVWMQGFGERFTADEMMKGKALTEEKQIWVAEEQKKVKALRKEIDASMKKAKKLLNK